MFGRKKDGAKISDRAPVFHVRYIGCTETFKATGTGCSYVPVQRLWDNSPPHRDMPKVAIHISPMGLSVRGMSEKATPTTTPTPQQQHQRQQHQTYYHHDDNNQLQQQQQQQHPRPVSQDFAIENISFCNVDRAVNERIFSWIYRSSNISSHGADDGRRRPYRLECHAVLCSTAQKAQTMAIVLSRAFQIAYKDWRAHNRGSNHPVKRSTTTLPVTAERERSHAPPTTSPPPLPTAAPSVTASSASTPPLPGRAGRWNPGAMFASADGVTSDGMTSSAYPPLSLSIQQTTTSSSSSSSPALPSLGTADDLATANDDVDNDSDDYDAASKDVTSSVSVQQAATSSYFMSSYIMWEPELREMVGGEGELESLQAHIDLEEGSDSN